MNMNVIKQEEQRLIRRLKDNLFLTRCRNANVQLDELKILLVQHGIYSSFFTRYLCAVMANLSHNRGVLDLAENLFEELGFMPGSATPHYIMYGNMLKDFELTITEAPILKETQQLIETMFHYCRQTDSAYGMGALCLGAEALVPSMYSDILKAFEACGVDKSRVEFFHIHVECDDGHAETMMELMIEQIDRDASSLQRIVQAGSALVSARESFFNGIMASARNGINMH